MKLLATILPILLSIPRTLSFPLLQARSAAPCSDLETIMNSYGTLEGSLQGAMIFFPRSQFATVTRELLRVIDEGTLNVHELYALLGDACVLPGSGEYLLKRENGLAARLGVCEALSKVVKDVKQVVDLTGQVAAAPDLPESLYIEALEEAAQEAGRSVEVVKESLKVSDGCV